MAKKTCTYIWYYRSRWIVSSRLFIEKKYIVHGVKRRSSSFNTERIDHIYQDPHETKKILFYIMEMLQTLHLFLKLLKL